MLMFSVRQVRRDEKKYYEDLLQYSKQHLMVSWLKNTHFVKPHAKVLHPQFTVYVMFDMDGWFNIHNLNYP